MPLKDKNFEKLQKQWYSKLAKDGFKDIEQADGNLKAWTKTEDRKRYLGSSWQQKETYFRYVGWFLHDYKFSNSFDKQLWVWRAEGRSIRWITKAFLGLGIPAYKDKVHTRLNALEKEMVKMYAARDSK
jgi:hypothetical protein